jgi:hypothetical protein
MVMKIQIIDAKQNFRAWPSLLEKRRIQCELVVKFFDNKAAMETSLRDAPPDVVLCHANDLRRDSEFDGDYIANCTRSGSHVLLFTGGSVIVSVLSPDRISLKTTEMKNSVEIANCKSELIHGCVRHIHSASDFPIENAITAALESKSGGGATPAQAFIDALMGYNPLLERSLFLLYASLITEDLRKFIDSEEYEMLLSDIPAKVKLAVEDNVAMLLSGSNGERVVLIRELRDALLPAG